MYPFDLTEENKRFAQNKVDGTVELWCDGMKLGHDIYEKAPKLNESAVVDKKRCYRSAEKYKTKRGGVVELDKTSLVARRNDSSGA